MIAIADVIRRNAERLESLHARIGETVKHRSRSARDREVWSRACSAFHSQFADLAFPGGLRAWSAFMSGDSAETETALVYLEVDPWHFRSGYQKEMIWDRFKKMHLAPPELRRLEHVALAYLPKRAYRHFWYMARFACLCATDSFWSEIASLSEASSRTPQSIKATWLVLARSNLPVRDWISTELFRARYESGYHANLDFVGRT